AGSWHMSDALIGSANNDRKNGEKSVRLRNGYIETNFDITSGVGTVSVLHALYGNDANTSWQLFASTDGGVTWSAYVSDVITTTSTTLEEATFTLNLSGNVRLRIEKNDDERLNLDDIYITPFTTVITPTASFELEDLHIEHNINATTPTVAEANINIANLTEEFNLSVVSTTEDFVVNTTGELVNGENTIQIQLADGLAAEVYTGSIIVSLGEEILATLPLTGEVVDIPLSTPENAIEGLRIYPNPATDVVFVTSNSGAMKNVQLFDITGKQVMNVETTSNINVASLNKGMYVMKITEEGKTATSKLVIK